jgi:hypothetical protein
MPAEWKALAGFWFLVAHPIRATAMLLCTLATVGWFAPGTVEAQAAAAPAPEFQNLESAIRIQPGITCLEADELVQHVASWLGTQRIAAPLSIEVYGSPYFARTVWFRIRRDDITLAERRFEPAPARCADLHAAVGLAIALALKASLLDSLIADQTRVLAPVSHPFRILPQALVGARVVPGASIGAGLSLQRSLAERVAARLLVLALVGPYGDFREDQGRFTTWLGLARLDVCSQLVALESATISACLGVAAGGLYALGEAFPMSRRALIAYVAVANALELDIELSTHWSLTVALDVLVPLRRTSFVVRDQTDSVIATDDLAAAGVLLAVGPAYRF